MVNKQVEVRNGLLFQFSVPADNDEYIKAANRGPNALLEDALDNNIYRTGLPDAWDMLAKALEKEYGVKKLTKPHPTAERAAKGETVTNETDPAYVDRVAALKSLDPTAFQPIVNSFEVIPLDLTERRGKGGGALVGKGDLDMAGVWLDAGPEKYTAALRKLADAVGGDPVAVTGDRAVDQRNIALAIKAFRAQAAKSLLG